MQSQIFLSHKVLLKSHDHLKLEALDPRSSEAIPVLSYFRQ